MFTRHLFLIGMPASGKSSIGKRAAREANLPFVDTDEMITAISGMSIPDLFARYGEEAFRKAETRVLVEVSRLQPALISTGGGTILKSENRRIMRCWGAIAFLDRSPEQIMEHLKTDNRPLLQSGGEEALRKLYEERYPIYRSTADFVIRNDGDYMQTLHRLVSLLRDRLGA